MRAQLGALFGGRLDTRFCPRPFRPRPAGREAPGVARDDAPGSAPLTYPSDEIVAALRDAKPMELAGLQEAVDLLREDLKSDVAALNPEGMIAIVEGERLLGGRYSWFGDSGHEPERRRTASVRITSRGSRFLDSVTATMVPGPVEATAVVNSLQPLQSPARPEDAIA